MDRAQLLAKIHSTRAAWDALLALIPDEEMIQEQEGGWSVKDVIAHLTWHEREMIGVIRARSLVGSELWDLPLQERNHAIYQANKDRSLQDVRSEAREIYPQLIEQLATLSDDELKEPGCFSGMPAEWKPWELFASNTCDHYREHLEQVQSWKIVSGE
jgi:uncharacterized damage-inducible protein DinB